MKFELAPQLNRRFSFIPDDLRYFKTHFVCEPMAYSWELPPVTPDGTSYKAADFVLWMIRAPVISERAKDALSNLCAGLVEFLPFHPIKGRPYFAVNMLNRDDRQPIYKTDPESVAFVDERFGAVVRDFKLSGVALADPANDINRRVVRGQSLHDFPGLVG
ncbi:MAG: hypothetical protein ACXWJC_10835 [Croceibacterium sp.]